MSRSASRSASTPSRIMPPSRASAGGSSTSADASASRTSARSSSSPTRLPDQRRRHRLEHQPDARDRGQRLAQRDQVARAGRADRHAADEPLEIVDGAQRVAQAAALGRLEGELLDGVEAILDPLERGQRAHQPGAQPARAHHRLRPIEHGQQRAVAAALGALEDLEVAERHRIDQQAVLPLAPADGADVGEVDLLRVAQVLDQRAGGARRGGMAVQPEGVQAAGAQLVAQRLRGAIDAERPLVERRDGDAEARDLGQQRHRLDALRHDHLARAQHAELLVQRLASVGAGVLRGQELAGRGVEQAPRRADRRSLCRAGASASRKAGSRASR